jgi:hypothetical protein
MTSNITFSPSPEVPQEVDYGYMKRNPGIYQLTGEGKRIYDLNGRSFFLSTGNGTLTVLTNMNTRDGNGLWDAEGFVGHYKFIPVTASIQISISTK